MGGKTQQKPQSLQKKGCFRRKKEKTKKSGGKKNRWKGIYKQTKENKANKTNKTELDVKYALIVYSFIRITNKRGQARRPIFFRYNLSFLLFFQNTNKLKRRRTKTKNQNTTK